MSFHPQTPQSPMQFSPATASDPLHGSSNPMAVAATASTTLLTPAHSVNGSSASQPDMAMVEDSPHKRKRPVDDLGGDREQKKAYAEKLRSAIEGLHRDVGSKYLLLHSPHPESLPRTSEDLYEMFGLVGLAAEVAREKPNGEKNALRKTYKGHIKRLGVAGHFDVQKKQEDAPSDFMAMLQVPELEWNVHQVKGREISDGLSDLTLSNLGRALTMAKGPVAKSVWDASVLGDLAPPNGDASKLSSAKPTAPNTPLASSPGAMAGSHSTNTGANAGMGIGMGMGMGTGASGSTSSNANANTSMNLNRQKAPFLSPHDPNRPRRNIKKRSYGDSSYEGYNEGFPDDDGPGDNGYSTGEGEGSQKRRKKNQSTSSPYPPGSMRHQSYGPGMVGA